MQKPHNSNKLENNTVSIKPSEFKILKTRMHRENQSVQPQRSESNSSLSRYLNSSLDEDMQKLDILTVKNASARMGLVSVKQKIIELNLNKKLRSIEEIDESANDSTAIQQKTSLHTFDLLQKQKFREHLNYNDRIKSLDNLLLWD